MLYLGPFPPDAAAVITSLADMRGMSPTDYVAGLMRQAVRDFERDEGRSPWLGGLPVAADDDGPWRD